MAIKEGKRKSNDMVITMKKVEELFCLIILIIFVVLLVNTFKRVIFLPACLIMGALELFSLGYYFRDDKKKVNIVYVLFGSGVILLFISVIYTIMNTVQDMEDRDYIIILYDYYGDLFDIKHKEYFESYYFDNLSLGEISDNLCISRNAIHKGIKAMVDKLYFYEDKLGMYKKNQQLSKVVDMIDDEDIKNKLKDILESDQDGQK